MKIFDEFIKNLKNYEKNRNTNHFENYSLEPFSKVVALYPVLYDRKPLRISVVGTNGKGSVCHYLSLIFGSIGKTGLYTSPHIYDYRERISVDGELIPHHWLDNFIDTEPEEKLNYLKNLSYFELFTLISFLYFRDKNCDFEIYEAGLGGRLDATKIAGADILVITKIDLDHMEILGDTREKILKEKLGILTEKTKMLFYFPQVEIDGELIQNFLRKMDVNKNLTIYTYQNSIQNFKTYLDYNFNYAKFIFENINNTLKLDNDSPTIEYNKIKESPPQGRIFVVQNNPLRIFDVAHNPDAIKILLFSINNLYPEINWIILLGVLPDKDLISICNILSSFENIEKIYCCDFLPFRSVGIPRGKFENIDYENFKAISKSQKPILLTGSFRLLSLYESM